MANPRVLVIEDAFATRRLVEMVMSLEGFDVTESVDGPSGLEAALELVPDLIVLDIALPVMDGWQVLERLRAEPSTRHIPVMVITAHDTAESKSKADHATADGFVGKPFDLDRFRKEVRKIISAGALGAAAAG